MKTIILLLLTSALPIGNLSAQYRHDSIPVTDGYLHYYTKGKGEPVVLLQGNTGSSSYYMRMIADSLDDYKTILVDYQGVGKSNYKKADSSWTNIDNIVKDYETVRNHLKIPKWTLIGHSYGGQHALYYATHYPERTAKIINIGGVATDNQLMKYWFDNVSAYQSDAQRKELSEVTADANLSQMEKIRKMMELHSRSNADVENKAKSVIDYYPDEELLSSTNWEYQKAWMSRPDFFTLDFSKEVYALDIPIRLIQGRQDPVGERVPTLLNEYAKNSQLVFIEKCGHFPWVEKPEIFYRILREFLDEK